MLQKGYKNLVMSNINLPIGHTCRSANQARGSKQREKAYPFDWTLNNYEYVVKFLSEPCNNFLRDIEVGPKIYKQKYETTGDALSTNAEIPLIGVYDRYFNVILVHDFKPVVDCITSVKEKYLKRRERLIQDIKDSKKVTLHTNEWSEKTLKRESKVALNRFGKDLKSIFTPEKYTIEQVKDSIKKINSKIEINVKYWNE